MRDRSMRRASLLTFVLRSIVILAVGTVAPPALAYRPFDGTDADVAETGNFELELGPVHWYSQSDRHYLIAPATVLNLGLLPRWELVVDFQNFVGLDAPPGQPRDQLLDTDVFTKVVLLPGVLQGKGTGPSRSCPTSTGRSPSARRRTSSSPSTGAPSPCT
jgi:hypothetical protein